MNHREMRLDLSRDVIDACDSLSRLRYHLASGHKVDLDDQLKNQLRQLNETLNRICGTPDQWPQPSPDDPDFAHYARLATWSIPEAVAICVGVDPDRVPQDDGPRWVGEEGSWPQSDRIDNPLLIEAYNAVAAGKLSELVSPLKFIEWLEAGGRKADPRIKEKVLEFWRLHQEIGETEMGANKDRASDVTKRRQSANRLLLFLAHKANVLSLLKRPEPASVSEAAKEVVRDMNFDSQIAKFKIDANTVERRLNDAVQDVWPPRTEKKNA